MPSLKAAPISSRVWISEHRLPSPRLTTRYGDVSRIEPQRDPNVPDEAMPAVIVDPARPGFGYTGRVLGVGPVILIADDTLNQVMQWQHRMSQPWPFGGVSTVFYPNTRLLTIRSANGFWTWRVEPAYYPTVRDPLAWCVGFLR
jgi:hypothetical protein